MTAIVTSETANTTSPKLTLRTSLVVGGVVDVADGHRDRCPRPRAGRGVSAARLFSQPERGRRRTRRGQDRRGERRTAPRGRARAGTSQHHRAVGRREHAVADRELDADRPRRARVSSSATRSSGLPFAGCDRVDRQHERAGRRRGTRPPRRRVVVMRDRAIVYAPVVPFGRRGVGTKGRDMRPAGPCGRTRSARADAGGRLERARRASRRRRRLGGSHDPDGPARTRSRVRRGAGADDGEGDARRADRATSTPPRIEPERRGRSRRAIRRPPSPGPAARRASVAARR